MWMRDEFPKKCKELGKPVIDHFFDLWHIGKSELLHVVTKSADNYQDLNHKTNKSGVN